jgi:hypothetical protein
MKLVAAGCGVQVAGATVPGGKAGQGVVRPEIRPSVAVAAGETAANTVAVGVTAGVGGWPVAISAAVRVGTKTSTAGVGCGFCRVRIMGVTMPRVSAPATIATITIRTNHHGILPGIFCFASGPPSNTVRIF